MALNLAQASPQYNPPKKPNLRIVPHEADDWSAFEDSYDEVPSYQERFYENVKAASAVTDADLQAADAVYNPVVGKSAFEIGKDPRVVEEARKLQTSGDHLALFAFVTHHERALGFDYDAFHSNARNLVIKNERLNPEDPHVDDKIDLLVHAHETEKSRAEIQAQYSQNARHVDYNPLLNIGKNRNGSPKVALDDNLYADSLRQSKFHENPLARAMAEDMRNGLYDTSNILDATRASIGSEQQPQSPAPSIMDRAKSFGSKAVETVKQTASSWWSKAKNTAKSLFGR